MRRLGGTLALCCLATAGVLVAPVGTTAAGADPIGSCTTASGAIVAVDFAHWGGPIVRGCGVNQRSGYALLHAAGFTTAGDSHDGPGFICRIGNRAFANGTEYPTPAQVPCVLTPPVSAYWSYWYAAAGQSSWSYSQLGVTSQVPAAGEVELWIFGGTDLGGTSGTAVPTVSPDALRAHNASSTAGSSVPATATPAPRPPTPTTTPATTVDSARGAATVPSTTSPGGGKSPSSSGTTPTSTPSVTRSATGSSPVSRADPAAPTKLVDALPPVESHPSSGSAVPMLIGLSLVIVLSGGAAGTTWRRRQRE